MNFLVPSTNVVRAPSAAIASSVERSFSATARAATSAAISSRSAGPKKTFHPITSRPAAARPATTLAVGNPATLRRIVRFYGLKLIFRVGRTTEDQPPARSRVQVRVALAALQPGEGR